MRKLGSISGGYLAISGGPAAQAGAHLSALKRPLPAAAGLAAAMGAPARRKLRPLSGLREEKISDPLMPQSMKRNLIIQASVPPGGASAAGNIEDGVTADAPASDRSGGPVFPSRPTRTFCVQTGETRQNGADKRVANRPQKAAFPSLRRAADDPPKAEQKRRFTAQKTVQKPPSGGKPSRESGCSEIDGTLLQPRPRPPLSRRAETAVRARRNLSNSAGFWRKMLDNKVSLC